MNNAVSVASSRVAKDDTRRWRRHLTIIAVLLCGLRVTMAQDVEHGARFRISHDSLQACRRPDSQVLIVVTNVNDPSDAKRTVTVSCQAVADNPGQDTPHVDVTEEPAAHPLDAALWLSIRHFSQAVLVANGWGRSGTIRFLPDAIVVSDLPLRPHRYHLEVTLVSGRTREVLINRDFDVHRDKGVSESEFDIHQETFYELMSAMVSPQRLLASAVVGLSALILALLRKRIEAGLEWLLDELGRRTRGQLADRRFEKRLVAHVISSHKYLRLIGLNTAGISRPPLDQVFISLRVVSGETLQRGQSTRDGLSLSSAIAQFSKIAILGGPGAGKTTTLSYAALQFATGQGEKTFGIRQPLVPVYLPLRRLSATNAGILDDIMDRESQLLPAELVREIPHRYFERRLERGGCIVLLDGFDEVTDERTHRVVAEKINRFVSEYPDNRFIVTCRPAGWRNLLNDFRVLEAQDFPREDVHRFIHGWHRAIITQAERNRLELEIPDPERFAAVWRQHRLTTVQTAIDLHSRSLINAIDGNQRILAIARNPMLLSLICLVHLNRNILPKERAVLYGQCIDLLIDAWDRSRDLISPLKITSTQKEAVLRHVAYHFQSSGKGESSREDLEALIERMAPALGVQVPTPQLLDDIEKRSGLLVERSIGILGFSHLTLQEYLAAKHIRLNADQYHALEANFDNQDWREVVLLYAGLIDDASALIASIVGDGESRSRWSLAGYTLGEANRCEPALVRDIWQRLWTELKPDGSDSVHVLDTLSVMLADYDSVPRTEEQQLSAELIAQLDAGGPSASQAIALLGKARITRALGRLVEFLDSSDPEVQQDAAEALTMFGNLSLEPILDHLRSSVLPRETADCYVSTMATIDTGNAARALIKTYDWWYIGEQRWLVSRALCKLLKNPFVFADLSELSPEDLPEGLMVPVSDTNGWDYGSGVSESFYRLEARLRHDLIEMMTFNHGAAPAAWSELDPRVSFAAFLQFIRQYAFEMAPEQWRSFGFKIESTNDVTLLRSIRSELRTRAAHLRTTITSFEPDKSNSLSPTEVLGRVWYRRTLETLLGLCALHSVALATLVTVLVFWEGATYPIQRVVIGLGVCSLVCTIVAGVTAVSQKHRSHFARLRSLIFPLTVLLWVVPRWSKRRPVVNLIMFQAAYGLTQLSGTLTLFIPWSIWRQWELSNVGLEAFIIMTGSFPLFLLASSLYYFSFVSRVDIVGYLMNLHPRFQSLLRRTRNGSAHAAAIGVELHSEEAAV
jgi:hypothetical protein